VTGTGPAALTAVVMTMFVMEILGVPFAWKKTRGGIQADWVGYWLDLRTFEVGLSLKRVEWLRSWLRKKLEAEVTLVRELKEGLGRLAFAAGPLFWLRPFLGPLYAWSSACPPGACLPLPKMLRAVMVWMERSLRERRLLSCRDLAVAHRGELLRVDAK
jgi:hypothetical protein